ncbi:MAG: SIS domain-containing protein [Anaerolineae bacterium]|nr:SIS domain-containing protein [Anaerolineae bacterium]
MAENIYAHLESIPVEQLVEIGLAGVSQRETLLDAVLARVAAQLPTVLRGATCDRVYLVGCGDSLFAGLAARFAFERLTGIPVSVVESLDLARYSLVPETALVIAISNSGEVAMTVAAAQTAQEAGAQVVALTGSGESSLARVAPAVVSAPCIAREDFAAQAGRILGNFSFNLLALYVMAMHLGQQLGTLAAPDATRYAAELQRLPGAAGRVVALAPELGDYLEQVDEATDVFFLGAGPSYGVALFYQAKFFEQVQRPVYAAHLEEFVHEQFYLLRPSRQAQVWVLAPSGANLQRGLDLMAGFRQAGAHTAAVTTGESGRVGRVADFVFDVGPVPEMFSPVVTSVPGELLGIQALRRWGKGGFIGAHRGQQMAINRQLTRMNVTSPQISRGQHG